MLSHICSLCPATQFSSRLYPVGTLPGTAPPLFCSPDIDALLAGCGNKVRALYASFQTNISDNITASTYITAGWCKVCFW